MTSLPEARASLQVFNTGEIGGLGFCQQGLNLHDDISGGLGETAVLEIIIIGIRDVTPLQDGATGSRERGVVFKDQQGLGDGEWFRPLRLLFLGHWGSPSRFSRV